MSQPKSLSHEIADNLRSDILSQRYRSGDRLPSERDLAARFAASRGAVREALSQLEQIGLVQIHPGGARVRPIEEASIAVLGPLMRLNEIPEPVLVDQFLLTFGALAALNARQAVLLATEEQAEELLQRIQALAAKRSDRAGAERCWLALMETLAEQADNLVVRLISNDLKAQFVNQMMKLGVKPMPGSQSLKEFLDHLARASRERDPELAQHSVMRYFDVLRQAMSEALASRLAS